MKKFNYMNAVYTFVSIYLLAITVSCGCKKKPSHQAKDKNNYSNPNDIEKQDPAHILLSSNKTNLLLNEKTFQILLNNQTEAAANLADYKLKISLQEQGSATGSTLHYKDVNNQPHDQSKIEQTLSHFLKQPTLKKGEATIKLPFEIQNVSGVTRIVITAALEHKANKDNVLPIKIEWIGLTPITDEMIREAQANNFEALAKKLTGLKEVEQPIDANKSTIDIDEFINKFTKLADVAKTASYEAVKLGNLDIVKALLERGEPFETYNLMEDLLELAIREKKAAIAKLIMQQRDKKELSKKNMFGSTLLHAAINNDNTEIAKALIDKLDVATLNHKEKIANKTPIQIAIEKGNTEIALILIEKLAQEVLGKEFHKGGILRELNHSDNTTLLHLAIENDNTEIAKALINKLDASQLNVGKDITYTAYNPFARAFTTLEGLITPFQLAMQKANIAVANALIEKLNGTQLNEQDVDGNTALHLAAKNNGLEMVKRLLSKGVDKTIKNKKGYTPYDVTSDREIRDLLEI